MAEIDQGQVGESTIGERLRTAREAKGVTLDEIAQQTRIPVRHLEHIERSEWEALPAITYSVGFARSYANAVGLDGPAIGAELREHLGGGRGSSSALTAQYEPADPARVPPRSLALVAVLLAVLLVGGYLFWRSGAVEESSPAETAIAASQEDPAAAARNPQAGAPRAAPQPQAASGPVVLTAREEVWLNITDGGQRLYLGTMKPGERYEVPAGAQAPQIVTSRPNVIQVTVGATQIPPLGPPEKRIKGVSLRAADLVARLQAPAGGSGAAPAASAPPAG